MEGLIPMVYRAIKKNKTRRKYRCLSTGAAQSYSNIDDFHSENRSPQKQKVSDFHPEKNGHRRYKSVGDYGFGSSTPDKKHGVLALQTRNNSVH
ncbi:RNA-binding protein [Quillaja saponaria]|uniref:RNA-binding protein n=1 Tax=Quillaja saponaria TaxID=32244 RepID=A0AAD7LFX7_QUISA|nr:RNA-binding protein [Quillaja saponaria]